MQNFLYSTTWTSQDLVETCLSTQPDLSGKLNFGRPFSLKPALDKRISLIEAPRLSFVKCQGI